MVVEFTTTYVISPYHHNSCEFESRSWQHYVIKFVSDLWQVGVFSKYSISSTNKTDRQNITEILVKVALNTITHNPIINMFRSYK